MKDFLNTNQAQRERMCLEVLATLVGYSDAHARLPKGGPDGGRDLQALYNGTQCYGAVGFVNDATDLKQHRDQISAKFSADLQRAVNAAKEEQIILACFVFFTNVGLTPSIIENMKTYAKNEGVERCEVLDRERIRFLLDSNKGYAIRFRYLDISLSDAEQKDFFYTWSDRISEMITSSISGLDSATKRIQFLLESQKIVDSLITIVRLDCSLDQASRGNFLFQTSISFQTHVDGLMAYFYGGANEPIKESLSEWEARGRNFPKNGQYEYGFAWLIPGYPQYEKFIGESEGYETPINIADLNERKEFIRIKSFSGILELQNEFLRFECVSYPFLDRFYPSLKLIEMNSSMVLFDCNAKVAEHIRSITMYANGFEILNLKQDNWHCEPSSISRFHLPKETNSSELGAEYVTLRPSSMCSCFNIDFDDRTPKRYNWE
ncbi:hypothetical protein [Methylopila sp. M107]|uniref:hypothetical protein n=1 Tax=Methylopila sp. M107 TaxID=1101190 RepID=UPI0012DCC0BD|nr:hypothetical protein [Methylopila sp. M107]